MYTKAYENDGSEGISNFIASMTAAIIVFSVKTVNVSKQRY